MAIGKSPAERAPSAPAETENRAPQQPENAEAAFAKSPEIQVLGPVETDIEIALREKRKETMKQTQAELAALMEELPNLPA